MAASNKMPRYSTTSSVRSGFSVERRIRSSVKLRQAQAGNRERSEEHGDDAEHEERGADDRQRQFPYRGA